MMVFFFYLIVNLRHKKEKKERKNQREEGCLGKEVMHVKDIGLITEE